MYNNKKNGESRFFIALFHKNKDTTQKSLAIYVLNFLA